MRGLAAYGAREVKYVQGVDKDLKLLRFDEI
jgi:hypothetical protein